MSRHTIKNIQLMTFIGLLFSASVSFAMSGKPRTDNNIEQALLSTLRQATSHYNANDLDKYLSMYTEDAWHISVRRPMAMGREQIGRFFAKGMQLFTVESEEEVLEAEQYGDTAHLLFKATLTGKPRAGINIPEFTEKRIIMAVFKKHHATGWQIHRYIASFSPEKDGGVMTKGQ